MSDIITPDGFGKPNPAIIASHHAELTKAIVTAIEEHRQFLPLALTLGILQTIMQDIHLNTYLQVQAQQTAIAQRALEQARQLRKVDG